MNVPKPIFVKRQLSTTVAGMRPNSKINPAMYSPWEISMIKTIIFEAIKANVMMGKVLEGFASRRGIMY